LDNIVVCPMFIELREVVKSTSNNFYITYSLSLI
jgi:hypothetical protein